MIERSGDAEALALPAGEAYATLAHGCLVLSRWFVSHKVVQVGDFGGALHCGLVDVFGIEAKSDVGGHGVIHQIDLLWHIANRTLPGFSVVFGDGLAVDF